MQKIFIKYLCGVMVVAMLAILLLNYVLQSYNAQQKMAESSRIKIDQIYQTIVNNRKELENLIDSLDEDYLTRASAFAYIIEQNPAVLNSQQELNKIKGLLNVDELHVIDEMGFLRYGTIPQYFGMDFRSSEQTMEFLQILTNPSVEFSQKMQANGAEQKLFQYAGLARKDRSGIVQVGLAPRRQVEARQRNELPYLFGRMPVDANSHLFAIDSKSSIVLAHTNEKYIGKDSTTLGLSEEYLLRFKNGQIFMAADDSEQRFYVIKQYDDIILGVSQTEGALYAGRNGQISLILFYLLATFCIVIFVIDQLLKKQIVTGIYQIMDDLSEITKGNLDMVVKVDNNPEFAELSEKVNKMVGNLLETTVKISRIIDLVEAPIGAFEYKKDMDRVLATDRLRYLLSLSEEEASVLYQNKLNFICKIRECMQYPESDEEDVYRISNVLDKWLRIRTMSDDTGTFGIVIDVTKEQQIKKERDYDVLTGLYSRRAFTRKVTALLEQQELAITALIMLDLDAFKQINDRYGHDCGDAYLKATADFLAELNSEGHCTAGRRSGDEFYLFFHNFAVKDDIRKLLAMFYERLGQHNFSFPDGSVGKIRISAGLAWYDEKLVDFDDLLMAADQALYATKASGIAGFQEYESAE